MRDPGLSRFKKKGKKGSEIPPWGIKKRKGKGQLPRARGEAQNLGGRK